MKIRSIVIALVAAAIVAGGAIFYANVRTKAAENVFADSGYILTSEPESESKRVLFSAGTAWRAGLSDTVSFDDVQGNKASVPQQSFVHYEDESVSAFSGGVLVDLNDVDSSQLTSHYALSANMTLAKNGQSYELQNTATELSMTDFVWKLGADKYLFCSDNISVQFSEGDVREAGSYIEVTYIDDGVIQVQTEDNIWQTISGDCVALMDNGEHVNLSYRNVSDEDGEVLIDFAKIVLDADSNIEVTPLTEELANVHETVIPHFDITAESGADGDNGVNGDKGTTGDDGETGTEGSSGESGKNGAKGGSGASGASGAPGESGTNGAAGNPGDPGLSGNNGLSGVVEGTVLSYPVFTIDGWTVSATGCSGTIMVSSTAMLNSLNTTPSVDVYVVDMETGTAIRNTFSTDTGHFDFATEKPAGYDFSFGGLVPDHNYRLVVNAKINTHLEGATDYTRDFISKTFWTDSLGIVMEKKEVTVDSATVSVTKQDYASANLESVSLYWYTTRADALGKSGQSFYTAKFESGSTEEYLYTPLDPNTTYYVRAEIAMKEGSSSSRYWTEQLLEVRTLKRTPTVGASSVSGNRDSWGLNIVPGVSYDPDKGITDYVYEIYDESSVLNGELKIGAKPVKTVSTSSDSGILTVPVDGANIFTGTGYYIRTVAMFYDNEKQISVYSPLSNRASVDGSRRPSVYFVNSGEQSLTQSATAVDLSDWYDKMYGTLVIAPGTDTAKVLLDATHHPTVTIRASGYYYAQYPVYWYDTAQNGYMDPAIENLEKGTYLTAKKSADGSYIYIDLPNADLSKLKTGLLPNNDAALNSAGSAAIYGLRPDTQFQIIVTGDLTNDGTNTTESGVTIGSCVVETPDTSVVQAIWKDYDANSGGNQIQTKFRLTSLDVVTYANGSAKDFMQEDEDLQFREDIGNIDAITLTLRAGNKSNPGSTLSEITLTEDNYKTYFLADSLNEWVDDEDMTLAKALTSGAMVLSEKTFGVESKQVESCGVVTITASSAYDYTTLSKNRMQQKQYASIMDGSIGAPAAGSSDGAVYINAYKFSQSTGEISHEIKLQTQPDPVPDNNKGFLFLQGFDATKDDVNDYYLMSPNYLNTGRLAKTITFYAFDAPMFEKDYMSDSNWEKTLEFADMTDVPKIATDVCQYGEEQGGVRPVTGVPYLGKITLSIPLTGAMPNVKFACYTMEDYFRTILYPKDTVKAQEAIDSYVPGTYTEIYKGVEYYVYFLDELQSEQPSSGHQFIFAWTLTYRLESDSSTVVRQYPYEMAAFQDADAVNKYKVIPHSAAQDCPRYTPEITAIPYTSSRTVSATSSTKYDFSSTWVVYVYDPQGAVLETAENSGKAAVYERTNILDGKLNTAFELNIHKDKELESYNDLVAQGDLCTLTRTAQAATAGFSSTPLAIRYQLYTDLYTEGGNGIFQGDTQKGYTPATLTYTEHNFIRQAGGAKVLPYYVNALTITIDPASYLRSNTIDNYLDEETGMLYSSGEQTKRNTVTIVKRDVDGLTGAQATGAINSYSVTVFTHTELLNEVSGLRLTFTPSSGAPVTVDTWLDGADTVIENQVTNWEGNVVGVEKTFTIRISRDLMELAGKSNVKVSACYLYETGEEGFGYQSSTQSLKTYTYSETNKKLAMAVSGRYRFNSSAALIERKASSSDPGYRFGDFLRITPSGGLTGQNATVSLDVKTSRSSYSVKYFKELTGGKINIAVGYRDTTGLVLVPMKLAESAGIYTTLDGKDGSEGISIAKITPMIAYSGINTSANSAEAKYTISGSGVTENNLYFMLRKGTQICVWGTEDGGKSYRWLESGQSFADTVAITNEMAAQYLYNAKTGTPKADGSANNASNKCAGLSLLASNDIEYIGLDADSEYTVMAYYRDGSKWVRLNMAQGESEVGNYSQMKTYSEPTVSISAAVQHSNYSNRQILTYLNITEVANFYYTLELQDREGNFIGFLSCGKSDDDLLTAGYGRFDVGYGRSATHGYVYAGNTIRQIDADNTIFDVDNTGAVKQALRFGESYRLQVRVYEMGKGPAYSTAYDRAADTDNLIHTISNSVAAFTVSSDISVMNIVGSFAIDVGDSNRPVITFKTMYVRNSADIRDDKIAVVAIRARTDPDTNVTTYTDVTEYLSWDGLAADMNITVGDVGNHTIQLRQRDVAGEPLLKQEDVVTCYVYGIRDSLTDTGVTTKGVRWPTGQTAQERRTSIIAGRGEGGVLYSTKDIYTDIDRGVSELLGSYSVKYVSSEIYAGAVSITQNADYNGYVITLINPVNIGAITGIEYTIVATDDTEQSYAPKYYNGAVSFISVAENTYQTEIQNVAFALDGTPESVKYMVSIKFLTVDSGGVVTAVPMEVGGNETYNSERRTLTAVFSVEDAEEFRNSQQGRLLALEQPEILPRQTADLKTEEPAAETSEEKQTKTAVPAEEKPKAEDSGGTEGPPEKTE